MKTTSYTLGSENRSHVEVLMDDGTIKRFPARRLKVNMQWYFRHNGERIFIKDIPSAKWDGYKFV